MKTYNRIAVLGLGLIGSSLARIFIETKLTAHIAAFDVSQHTLDYAIRHHFAHSHHAHAGQAVENADLIILATPPSSFASLMKDIAPFIKNGSIIMDMASIKRSAIAAIRKELPAQAYYVPAHPIAGSEKNGPEAGFATLFAGKHVILTPDESDVMSESVTQMRALWQTIGAKVELMPAELHDRIYAYVSHLPQLAAFATAEPLHNLPLEQSEVFERFTRLTHSDPVLWADICVANADFIGDALTDFISFTTQIMSELSENATDSNGDASIAAGLFPKIVSTCLIATVSLLQEHIGIHPARYAGKGFADMTAPALDDPEAALQAISEHHGTIAKLLGIMLAKLHDIKIALESRDRSTLAKQLKSNY